MTAPIPRQAVDPRAGRMCSHCNAPKPNPRDLKKHYPSRLCPWWHCTRCGADNDAQGRNTITSLDGQRKDGKQR